MISTKVIPIFAIKFCIVLFIFRKCVGVTDGNIVTVSIYQNCIGFNNILISAPEDESNTSVCHCSTKGFEGFRISINCQEAQFENHNFEAEILPIFADTLDMSWNLFQYVPSFDSEDLQKLDMSHNQVKEIDDKNFAKLPNLKELNLSWNKIEALSINAFDGLKNLLKLDLSRNLLSKITINVFSSIPHLEHLNLSRNRYLNETFNQTDADLFVTFGVTTKLKILEIEECDLDYIDLSLGVGLEWLHLKFNKFQRIPDLPRSLTRIDFSGNPIEKLESKFLPHLVNLRELYLMDMPNLTSIEEFSLFGMQQLRKISFEGSWNLNSFDSDAFGNADSNNETEHYLTVLNFRGTNLKFLNSSFVFVRLLELDLAGTPMVCNCDVKWLLQYHLETNAECVSPSSLRGKLVSELTIDELKCKRWKSWVYKTLNGLLVLLLLVMCGVATWLIVTGIRPNSGQLQKIGASSPYARVTIEPNRAEQLVH